MNFFSNVVPTLKFIAAKPEPAQILAATQNEEDAEKRSHHRMK